LFTSANADLPVGNDWTTSEYIFSGNWQHLRAIIVPNLEYCMTLNVYRLTSTRKNYPKLPTNYTTLVYCYKIVIMYNPKQVNVNVLGMLIVFLFSK